MYAEDVQLNTCFDPKDPVSIATALKKLACCIDAIKDYMKQNTLKLTDNKSEFFIATAAHSGTHMLAVSFHIGDKYIYPSDTVRVIFDSQMKMSSQIKSLK